MKARQTNQLLLFPMTSLGAATLCVVRNLEKLLDEKTDQRSDQKQRAGKERDSDREFHDRPHATRRDFGHGLGKPRSTAQAKPIKKE